MEESILFLIFKFENALNNHMFPSKRVKSRGETDVTLQCSYNKQIN